MKRLLACAAICGPRFDNLKKIYGIKYIILASRMSLERLPSMGRQPSYVPGGFK